MKIYNQYQYSYPHKNQYYPIDKKIIVDKLSSVTNSDLYIHLPFCSSKCGYCNLFSIVSNSNSNTNIVSIDDYIKAIKRQYIQLNQITSPKINSLILGGGTPSLLNINQLQLLFESININPKNHYSIIELSPAESTTEKLNYLKDISFNRVSIGIQSLVDSELDTINRNHSSKMCYTALENITKYNFDDFNIDLIYGIKGQTVDTLQHTLQNIIKFAPTEIFIYPLYIRENTWLYNRFEIDENHTFKLYLFLKEYLNLNGYYQTSMRRFTRKKIDSNISCGFNNCISYGCGGRSYVDDLHFCYEYSSNTKKVYNLIKEFNQSQDFLSNLVGYNLNELEMKKRYIIKNLLHVNGIDTKDYYNRFKSNINELVENSKYIECMQYIKITKDKITLKDFMCSDFIINLLFNEI